MFPGEYETVPLLFEKPEIPEECKEIGICDDIPNYPEELVSNLLNDVSSFVLNFFASLTDF